MASPIKQVSRVGALLACTSLLAACDGRFGRAMDALLEPLPSVAERIKPEQTPPPPPVYDATVLPGQPTYAANDALANRRIYEQVYEQDYSVPITGEAVDLQDRRISNLVFLDDPIADQRLNDPSLQLEGAAQDAMRSADLEVSPITTGIGEADRAALGLETRVPPREPRASLDELQQQRTAFAVAADDPYASPVPRSKPGKDGGLDVAMAPVEPAPAPTASVPRPGEPGYRPLPTAKALPGTSWRLATINGRSIRGTAELHFDGASGFAGGQAPCNDYGGEFSGGTEGTLSIRNIFATERACEFLDEELEYLEALEAAQGYRIGDYGLVLTGAPGVDLISFVRF